MKNILMISAAVLTATSILLTGCKKDEDDPPIVPNPVGPSLPQSGSLIFHANLDGTANPTTGNATVEEQAITWAVDRHGNGSRAAYFNGTIGSGSSVVEYSDMGFISSNMTISTWFKIDPTVFTSGRQMFGIAAERGFCFELAGDQAWCKMISSHENQGTGTEDYGTAWSDYLNGGSPVGGALIYNYNNPNQSDPDQTGLKPFFHNSNWHQIVMTYDANSGLKTFFVDGVKIMQHDVDYNADASSEWYLKNMALNNANATGVTVSPKLTLGYGSSRTNTATGWSMFSSTDNNHFIGSLDDFRIWNVALSESEVATLYDYEN
jgi:hypothetical protein